MSADRRTNVSIIYISKSKFFFDPFAKLSGLFRYIGMAYIKNLLFRIENEFSDDFMDALYGIFLSAYLFLNQQMPFQIKIQNRVNIKGTGNHHAGTADSSAAIKIGKIGCRIVGVDFSFMRIEPIHAFLWGPSIIPHIGGDKRKHTIANRSER